MAKSRSRDDLPVAQAIPFAFVLDELEGLELLVRPMFGCRAVYVGERIVMVLRKKGDADSGVWIATEIAHHAALRALLPSLRSIGVLGSGVTAWQNLPEDADTFEDEVLRACALVRAGDPRIGRVPKKRRLRSKRR